MLGRLAGLLAGGATGWVGAAIGGVKVLAIAGLIGTAIWYVDDYGYQKRERLRLEGEVAEAVAANESLERARKHEMMRHERELSALKSVAAVQVDVAEGMAALTERLALLAADACEVSQGLQQEIDDANKRRMQDAP